MGFDNNEIRYLTFDEMFVDPEVQRRQIMPWSSKLVGKFNPAKLGVLTGSMRTNGKVAIIDGQHRWNSAGSAGYEGKFEVKVYFNLTRAEEVEMFLALNDSRQVSALDQYRVRVNGGDDMVATAINKIITANGWQVTGSKKGAKNFAAVSTLERIYNTDVDTAHRVVFVPTAAWGYDSGAVDNRVIDGLGRVLLHYKDVWDQPARLEDLTEKLHRFTGGPGRLIAQGQQLAQLQGWRVGRGIAAVIIGEYNKAKRSDGPNYLEPLPR